jgi:AcrR family transcriptional regulator
LYAAVRVLARREYARTSLLEIAKEADTKKNALHNHYPTKEALLHAVLKTACNVVQARTVQAFVDPDACSPDDLVDAVQTIAISIFTEGSGR